MPDALPVTPTSLKMARLPRRTYCLLLTGARRIPELVPVARPRTHILIPFAGEATERGTSNENQQRTCGVQTAIGTISRLVKRKGQAK
jgi:hypothetical protein